MKNTTARILFSFSVLAGCLFARVGQAGAVIYTFGRDPSGPRSAGRSKLVYRNATIYPFSRVSRFQLPSDVQNPVTASLFVRSEYARVELQRHPMSPSERENFLASMRVTEEQLVALKPIFHLAYAPSAEQLFQPVPDQDVTRAIEILQPRPDDWLTVTGAKLLPIVLRLWQLAPDYYAQPNDPPNAWAELFARLERQIPQDSIALEWFVPERYSASAKLNEELVAHTREYLNPADPDFINNVKSYISLYDRLPDERQVQLANIINEQIPHAYAKSKRSLPYDPMHLPNGQPLIEFYLSHAPSEQSRADFLLMVLAQTGHELAVSKTDTVAKFADWLVTVVEPVIKTDEAFRKSVKKNLLDVPQFDSVTDLIARLRLYEPLRGYLRADPSEEKTLYDSYIDAWSESPTEWARSNTDKVLEHYLESRSPADNVGQVWIWLRKLLAHAPASPETNARQSNLLSFLLKYWAQHEPADLQRKNLTDLMRVYVRSPWFGKVGDFQLDLSIVLCRRLSRQSHASEIEKLFREIQVPIPQDRNGIRNSFLELKILFGQVRDLAGDNPALVSAFGHSYARNAALALRGAMLRTNAAPADDHVAQAIESLQDGVSDAADLLLDVKNYLPAAEYRNFLAEVATAGPAWSNAKGFMATMKYRKKRREYVNKLYQTLYDELNHATRPQLKVLRGGSCNRLLEKAPADTVSLQK